MHNKLMLVQSYQHVRLTHSNYCFKPPNGLPSGLFTSTISAFQNYFNIQRGLFLLYACENVKVLVFALEIDLYSKNLLPFTLL